MRGLSLYSAAAFQDPSSSENFHFQAVYHKEKSLRIGGAFVGYCAEMRLSHFSMTSWLRTLPVTFCRSARVNLIVPHRFTAQDPIQGLSWRSCDDAPL